MSQWKPIETAPRDGTYILLCRYSGYLATPYEYITGRMIPEYRGDAWLDVGGDRLSDSGRDPVYWMPLPQPPEAEDTEQ